MPQTFLIGYREDDPRAHMMDGGELRGRSGRTRGHMTLAGRCGQCRHNVWLNPSGVQAMRERDCVVYCATCAEETDSRGGKGYDHFIADLS